MEIKFPQQELQPDIPKPPGDPDYSGGQNSASSASSAAGARGPLLGDEGNNVIDDHDYVYEVYNGGYGASAGLGNPRYHYRDDPTELFGYGGNDVISGYGGNDTLHGGDGDDWLDGGTGNDTIWGGSDFDILLGREDNDDMHGGEQDDILLGEDGDDILVGDEGADSMYGGRGNDAYVVDDPEDWVEEDPSAQGGNADKVYTSLSFYDLSVYGSGVDVEHLQYIGAGDFVGKGNELDNWVVGANGSDTLDGRGGNDSLAGGDGRDTLYGGADDDWLDGEGDADWLYGGTGNDTYRVGAGDEVFENAIGSFAGAGADTDLYYVGPGVDRVETFLTDYSLPANVENLTFLDDIEPTAHTGRGNELDNVIVGSRGNDVVHGDAGDDVMVGGAGLDTLVGGADNDTYYLLDRSQVFVGDQLAGELYDRITEEAGGGIDTVRVSATQNTRTLEFNSSYTLPDNVEIGVVEGDRPFDLIGNDLDNKFYGNAAANTFAGGGGNDVVDYGLSETGVDVFLAEQALNGGGALGDRFDSIEGVAGTRFRDQLNGDDSSNNLWGFGDSDILDGGAGNDGMDGGEGDDAFYVDNGTAEGGDVVIGGAGFDQVIVDSVLAASGLRLNVFRDGTPITGEVNGVAYTSAAIGVEMIFGASGDDWIDASRLGTGEGLQVVAGGGHDTFVSGGGSDTFYGEAGIDTIVYSGPSSNYLVTATGRANEFTVTDRTTGVVDRINGVEALRFSDSESAATGFIATNQSFDGTAHWSESIVGGTGNDTISYANANYAIYVDLMREGGYAQALNAERWDQHVTAVENVTGSTSYINYLHGDGRDNVLIGGDNFDWLAGRGGSNTLDGRGGTDYADYYEMGGPVSIDLTVGQAVHGTGTDTLISVEQFRGTYFADTFIGDGVDNYFLGMHGNDTIRGNGGADWLDGYDGDDIIYGDQGDDRLFGEYDNDTLYGGADNDVLDGGAGNDTLSGGSGQNTLIGGLGDDVYLVDSAGDTIVESAGGGSLDRVVTSVSYMLTTGAEIEAFATSAPTGTAAINLTGNAFANAITGNAGANTIDGGLGRDILSGLAGADTFVFDTALSPNNIDTIADFTKGDRIALDDAIFGMAGPLGQLAGSAFYAGAAAHDASDRIIYNATTGAVLYDADGTGSAAAVQFATVTGQPVLHAADFWVI